MATSFVKRQSFSKRYFNTKGGKIEALFTLQMFLRALQWLKQAITLIGGCGNQEPSDTATESAPDTEVATREPRQQRRRQLY